MIDIETLTEKLKINYTDDLPGEIAQHKMQPKPRSDMYFPNSEEHATPSSVLILLFPHGNDIHFILTERTNDVQHHKGQISLPGGTWENGEQLHETATRETNEEIGIRQNSIKICCELTPLIVKITGYMIHPFIGYISQPPALIPNRNEVSNVFTVSIYDLIDTVNKKMELWTIRKIPVDVPFFIFGKYKVWGATAMILSEFRQCLKTII